MANGNLEEYEASAPCVTDITSMSYMPYLSFSLVGLSVPNHSSEIIWYAVLIVNILSHCFFFQVPALNCLLLDLTFLRCD